jgi:H/ACA ribonucleoprotein complex subunit 4
LILKNLKLFLYFEPFFYYLMGAPYSFNHPHEFLIKAEEEVDPNSGCDPLSRPLPTYLNKGLIILDKFVGITSHEIASWVKLLLYDLGVTKVGHGGTLDPKVSGVLPLALNEATHIQDILLSSTKEYICLMHIHQLLEENLVRETMNQFVGTISQLPPDRSAIKREIRSRNISRIEILEINEKDVLFRVECEAGTYIRTLCDDIGKKLQCGAHMTELRRIRSGAFSEDQGLISMQQIESAMQSWSVQHDLASIYKIVIPMEKAFELFPQIIICDKARKFLRQGENLKANDVLSLEKSIKHNDFITIFSQKGEILGTGRIFLSAEQIIEKSTGICGKILKVY